MTHIGSVCKEGVTDAQRWGWRRGRVARGARWSAGSAKEENMGAVTDASKIIAPFNAQAVSHVIFYIYYRINKLLYSFLWSENVATLFLLRYVMFFQSRRKSCLKNPIAPNSYLAMMRSCKTQHVVRKKFSRMSKYSGCWGHVAAVSPFQFQMGTFVTFHRPRCFLSCSVPL